MPVIATAAELAPGRMKRVDLQGSYVALVNVDGRYFAFADACAHGGCSLSQGRLDGGVIVCSRDGSRFDLATGNPVGGPAFKRVRTYRVQVSGDELVI